MKKFIPVILLLFTSTAFASSFTPEQRADAERVARSKTQFVGPRLPRVKKSKTESLGESIHKPQVAKVTRPKPAPKPKHPSFDGTYFYNADGGVIGMRTRCRPCWMVKAGLHYRR